VNIQRESAVVTTLESDSFILHAENVRTPSTRLAITPPNMRESDTVRECCDTMPDTGTRPDRVFAATRHNDVD
jgi:hypothetical protein